MSQIYTPLTGDTLACNLPAIVEQNMEAVATDFGGSSFPTENLFAFMKCYRSDLKTWFRLEADLTTWTEIQMGRATVAERLEQKHVTGITDNGDGTMTVAYAENETESTETVQTGKVKTVNGLEADDAGNIAIDEIEKAKSLNTLKRETAYAVGEIAYVSALPAGFYLECVTAGTTGTDELMFTTGEQTLHQQITDGTCVFKICVTPRAFSDIDDVLGVEQGGHGGTTIGEALENLGLDGAVVEASIASYSLKLTRANGDVISLTTSPYLGSATAIGGASATKPAVVVTSYMSGTDWYRIWSDGWLEQGGVVACTSSSATITMHKEFADTNYTLVCQDVKNSTTDTGGVDFGIKAGQFTTDSFYVSIVSGRSCSWFAAGCKA